MALVNRTKRPAQTAEQNDSEAKAAAQEPDVSELCVQLKELLRERVLAGMQSHEVQDLMVEVNILIDAIDVDYRYMSRAMQETKKDDQV